MSGLGVICKELHWRHAAQGPGDGFCSLCVVETIERRDVSAARKRAALLEVARGNEARELLYRDKAGYLNFSRTLLRMLFSVGDSALLDQAVDVLLQMSVDLSSQEFRLFILDELRTQCADGVSLSSVLFLGKLLESHPPLSQALTSSHRLRVCDEELKAAVCYALMMVWRSNAAVRTLPDPLRHCVCVLLLHTLTHAHTSALVHNALGVVKQMCQYPDCVCVLMNLKEHPKESFPFQTLPLIIKQLLLSSEDCVQTVCLQCVCAVMVHTPLMFSTSFLQADLPECVLECVCGGSEGLRWAGFTCLLQLCEDPMFFSQCHSVYGIEPLIRCVQETLGNSDIEVQKQGLTLLTTFLEKQPTAVRLFPTPCEFSTVANVVMKGVSNSCLQVSLCSVRTAAALLRANHQSDPVQLSEVRSIIETVMSRFTELQSCSGSGRVLLRILSFFDTACSLLEMYVCASSTSVEKKTLESVCVYLLDCCDTVCIPAAVGVCERLSSVHLLQLFFSVMCHQFSLSPDHMTHFSRKLASCGFIKLAVESKARLCSGNRNMNLNKVCCDFLLKMCAHLLPPETPELTDEVLCVLQDSLSSLCCEVSNWCAVLSEPRSLAHTQAQCCLIYLLHLSRLHGHRLLCDSAVFSAVRVFVCAHCDVTLPPSVQHSCLYLLSATQHCCPRLDKASVSCISASLSLSPSLARHSSVLNFIFEYEEMQQHLGLQVLTLRLSRGSEPDHEREDLLQLLRTHPAAVFSMLTVVCEAEAVVARSAAGVLSCFLSAGEHRSVCDLGRPVRSALLKMLQDSTHTADGQRDRVCVLLELLCVMHTHTHSDTDHADFTLLHHISNVVCWSSSSDSDLHISVLNYLYCFLCVCPSHCSERAVCVLLCNIKLMELLEEGCSLVSPSDLHSCSLLLLSSLVLLQHTHTAQVHRRVSVDLHVMVERLAFRKRNTHSLLLICSMRFVQVCLDVDDSALLHVYGNTSLRPLTPDDAVVYPLNLNMTHALFTTLSTLTLQKQEMVTSAAVKCLMSLVKFLERRSVDTALHLLSQPWTGFLLLSLLSCEGRCSLPSAALHLMSARVSYGVCQWESEVRTVCEEMKRQGVAQLRDAHTVKQLLTQCLSLAPPDDLRMMMETILESLDCHHPSEDAVKQQMIRIQRVFVCLSDFTLTVQIHQH